MSYIIRWLLPNIFSTSRVAICIIAGLSWVKVVYADTRLNGDMLGTMRYHTASYEDTLLDLERDNGLGFIEIVAANQGIDPWMPGDNTLITLPTGHLIPNTPREGLVINLAEHRLYNFGLENITTYAIGVGREGWNTPIGTTKIIRKQANPIWFPPESIRKEKPDLPVAVRAGPNNPLGQYALYFDWPGYLVHGTNMPWGVGRRVSHGCIRLYPEGIEKLFDEIAIGTNVLVVNQSIKIGRYEGDLYLEAYPEPKQVDALEANGRLGNLLPNKGTQNDTFFRIRTAAEKYKKDLDWPAIRRALVERTGIPVKIAH